MLSALLEISGQAERCPREFELIPRSSKKDDTGKHLKRNVHIYSVLKMLSQLEGSPREV